MKKIDITNALNLDDPSNWHCRVFDMTDGHSILRVRVRSLTQKDKYFIAEFRKVAQFFGSITWKGAWLTIASDNEMVTFLRQNNSEYLDLSEDEILIKPEVQNMSLYIFNSDKSQKVRIIANAMRLVDSKSA